MPRPVTDQELRELLERIIAELADCTHHGSDETRHAELIAEINTVLDAGGDALDAQTQPASG